MDKHTKLAVAFSAIVRRDLATELPEINRRNKTERYSNGSCATQDFTDANMLMAEAFESVMGRDVDGNIDADCDAWNAAWDLARAAEFSL